MLNKQYLSHSWKAGLALSITASFAFYFHLENFWWAVFVTLLSIQPSIGTSVKMAIGRFIGTWTGVLLGMALYQFYQFPWLLYPLLTVSFACCIYYIVKPNISWAGILCLVNLLNIIMIGPTAEKGVIHFAIDRGLEISLAIIVATLILTILRFAYAHKTLRNNLPKLLSDYHDMFWKIITPFCKAGQGRPNHLDIPPLIKTAYNKLAAQMVLLEDTRYEWTRKHFNPDHCLRLLHQFRRLLALMNSLRRAGTYCPVEEFSASDREEIQRFSQQVSAEIHKLAHWIKDTVTNQQIPILESQDYTHINQLIDKKIADIKAQYSQTSLHIVSWLTLLKRILEVLTQAKAIIIAMNSSTRSKPDSKLEQEFGGFVAAEKPPRWRVDPIRLRYAFHAGLSLMVVLFLQQWLHWSPMIPVVASLAIMFSLLSNISPVFGHMGWGMLGAIGGSVYAFLALIILNYYPHVYIVLAALFIGTMISSYFLVWSRAEGERFTIFSIYFGMIVVALLMAQPSDRGNLDLGIFATVGILLGTTLISLTSRYIWPYNFIEIFRRNVAKVLIKGCRIFQWFIHLPQKPRPQFDFHHAIYQLTPLLKQAEEFYRFMNEQGTLPKIGLNRGLRLIYLGEQLSLSLIMIQFFYYRRIENKAIINQFLTMLAPLTTLMADNFLTLSRRARCETTRQSMHPVTQLQALLNQELHDAVKLALVHEKPRHVMEVIAVVYNGIQRLIDLQNSFAEVLTEAQSTINSATMIPEH